MIFFIYTVIRIFTKAGIYIQNLGMFSVGRSLKEAKINGDVAELSLNSIINIERKSIFKSINHAAFFKKTG